MKADFKKEIVMIEAFSTPANPTRTLILLAACALLAIAAVVIGIDDNPPGGALALLAAIAFVLAFAHPWRRTRNFLFLFLASILGFILFIIQDILTNSILQSPTASEGLQNLLQGTAVEIVSLVLALIFVAAFFVGAIGPVVLFIRNRRKMK